MATQMLNDQTFSAENVRTVTLGRPVDRTMTYTGTVMRTLFLLVVTVIFAGGSSRSSPARAASGRENAVRHAA